MKKLKTAGLLAAAVLVLGSCAGIARIEKDDTVDFSRFKTFAWMEPADSVQQAPQALTERNLHSTVNARLQQAAWKENTKAPDVLVKHELAVEKKVKRGTGSMYPGPFFYPYAGHWGAFHYPAPFMGYGSGPYEVREGTLTLSLIDAKTNRVIWQGWTTKELAGRNFSGREIRSGVETILRKLDVKR